MAQHQGIGDALVGLSVIIQRRYAQICAEHDLTPVQATLLCIVKDGPRRMAELADSMGMARNALSQLVDRTERRGLVRRESQGQDGRAIALDVTPSGKQVAEALYADVTNRLPDIADDLEPEDRALLGRIATDVTARHMPGLIC